MQSDYFCVKKIIIGTVIAVFAAVSLLFAFCVGCPIKYITGISCPGCGLTRACISALQLDFQWAFYFHPLFWMIPLGILLFLFRKKTGPVILCTYAVVLILAFVVVYVIRLADPGNTIVEIDFAESVICRLLEYLQL